jgi:hypothetical protein
MKQTLRRIAQRHSIKCDCVSFELSAHDLELAKVVPSGLAQRIRDLKEVRNKVAFSIPRRDLEAEDEFIREAGEIIAALDSL